MITAAAITSATATTSENYRMAEYIVCENLAKRRHLIEHYARMDARAPYHYDDSERYIVEDVYHLTPTRPHHIYDSFEDATDAVLETIWGTWCAMDDNERSEYECFEDYEGDALCDYYFMPLNEWRANARRARFAFRTRLPHPKTEKSLHL